MSIRYAEAVWEGNLKEGIGKMQIGSGVYQGNYSYASRFEESPGSNPEELIGAALAGCFSMALSGDLGKMGITPTRIETKAKVHLDRVEGKPTITKIELETEAIIPDIDEASFLRQAEITKTGCPVSRALTAVEITLNAKLLKGGVAV